MFVVVLLIFFALLIFSVWRIVKLNRLGKDDPDNSHIYRHNRVKYIILIIFSVLGIAVMIWLMIMAIMIIKFM